MHRPCPKCNAVVAPKQLGFTWWGGVIGPKLLNHVECPQCHARYNGKTGGDNQTAILIYSIVVGGILVALVVALFTVWKH